MTGVGKLGGKNTFACFCIFHRGGVRFFIFFFQGGPLFFSFFAGGCTHFLWGGYKIEIVSKKPFLQNWVRYA